MLKAVIFDIDGTLLDSVDKHAEAWRRAMEHFGYSIPFSEIRYQIGKGGDKLLDTILTPDQIGKHGKLLEQYRKDLFKQEFLQLCRPFPGSRDLLERLRENGYRTALASSGKKDEVETNMRILDIVGLVDEATSSDDIEDSKPAPDALRVVRQKLGDLQSRECVFVGDSPYDAEAAARDEMEMVGLLCGGFPEQDLMNAGANRIFQDPQDLLRNWEPAAKTGNEKERAALKNGPLGVRS